MATPIDKVYSLAIGVQGENVARDIEFDMSVWAEQYPEAVFYVLFKPYNAVAASPQLSDYQDGILTWTPALGATAVAGVGYTEIRAIDPDTGMIRKSRIIPTSVEHSVTGANSEDPPEPFEDWVNNVLQSGTNAANAAAAVVAVSHGAEIDFEINNAGHLIFSYEEGE